MSDGYRFTNGSNSRMNRIMEAHARAAQAEEQAKRAARTKKRAEEARRLQIKLAWQPLFDRWILSREVPQLATDLIAKRVTEVIGFACTVTDINDRKRELRYQAKRKRHY